MDSAGIQDLIDKWFGIGGGGSGGGGGPGAIGLPYTLYRPSSASLPLAPVNSLGTIMAALSAEPTHTFAKPATTSPLWYPMLDRTLTQAGDYLVAANGLTFFIGGQEPLVPVWAVECNRVVSLLRPTGVSGVGAQPYGGDVTTTEVPQMTDWPASVLTKSRGDAGSIGLPGDVKAPWSEVLIPYAGVQILYDDVLVDDLGVRYLVSSTELTNAGYRMLVVQATA